MFKKIADFWKSRTSKEKLKLILMGVCDVGADLMMGMAVSSIMPEDTKLWKKAAVITTAGGLGMVVAKTASDGLNEIVDLCFDGWKEGDTNE